VKLRPGALVAATGLVAIGLVWAVLSLLEEEPADPGAAIGIRREPSRPAEPAFEADLELVEMEIEPLEPTLGLIGYEGASAADRLDVGLTIELLHADGAPASGACVVLAREGRVLDVDRTDVAGRARLDAFGDPADLFVTGAMHAPHRERLETPSGERQIVLPAGASISGRFTVQGLRPEQPIAVELASKAGAPVFNALPPAVRAAVRRSLPGFGDVGLQAPQLTDPDGQFRFSGLPSGLACRLDVSRRYRYAEGGAPDLVAPVNGLVLDLLPAVLVTGRVVMRQGGPAVPEASIELSGGRAAGTSLKVEADQGGRFAFNAEDFTLGGRLEISHPQGLGWRELEVDPVDPQVGRDLGDIELEAVRGVPFLAVDANGSPIAGAVAMAAGARSPPTGPDGTGLLPNLPTSVTSMTVWAHRFDPSEVVVPAEVREPLRVLLFPCPALDVFVTGPGGRPAEGAHVEISANEPLFGHPATLRSGGASFLPDGIVFDLGATNPSSGRLSRSKESGEVVAGSMGARVGVSGTVSFSDIRPGVPFTVSVRDTIGYVVWGPFELSLGAGERRRLDAAVAVMARALQVVVTDVRGEPVTDAYVTVTPAGQTGGRRQRTDASGETVVRDLFAPRVDLALAKSGFLSLRQEAVDVPPAGVPLLYVLTPGLELLVHVRDADGLPFAARRVWASLPEENLTLRGSAVLAGLLPGGEIERSLWKLTELPDRGVTLQVMAGRRIIRQDHHPRSGDAWVYVPREP
jgi:hypothetical protein